MLIVHRVGDVLISPLLVIYSPEVTHMNAVSEVGAPQQFTIARLK